MATNMLGIDLDLVDPKTVQDCIIKACVKKRFETGHSGLRNYADCSGFVKSVQSALNPSAIRRSCQQYL